MRNSTKNYDFLENIEKLHFFLYKKANNSGSLAKLENFDTSLGTSLTFLELDILGTISYIQNNSKPDDLEQRLSEFRKAENLFSLFKYINPSLEFDNHINLLRFLCKWQLNFFKQEIIIESKAMQSK